MTIPSYWVPIYHLDCTEVAFYLERRPYRGDSVLDIPAKMPDGEDVKKGDMAYCGSCLLPLSMKDLALDQRETTA